VFRATRPIFAKITYCLPAWSGLCSASDRAKLDSFLNRCKRLGFYDNTVPTISDIFSNADVSLFKAVLKNSYHVLYPYLPENQYQHYHLRQRPHNKALIRKTTCLSDRDCCTRTVISLLLHRAAVLLSPTVFMLYAILDTFTFLSISLLLCMYIV